MRITYGKSARGDLRTVTADYEKERPGLGLEFTAEVRAVLERCVAFPHAVPSDDRGTRRAALRRFPYNIIYYTRADALFVVAIFHKRRRPGFWKDRL